MTSLPRRILFVRHAESRWNAAGRWQGQADPELSAAGQEQLPALWRQFGSSSAELSAIYTSDLRRARETASFLARQSGLPLRLTRGFRERDAGRWTGVTRDWVLNSGSQLLAAIRSGDWDAAPPDGESRREVVARVARVLRAHPEEEGQVAVVSHLGVLRALMPGAEADNATAGWLELAETPASPVVATAWEPLS